MTRRARKGEDFVIRRFWLLGLALLLAAAAGGALNAAELLCTVLDGRRAVKEKLIDELGGLSDALAWLYREIERE